MTTFVGRDDTVSHITDRFIKHHKQIVLLLAPPGFGKSSVAIHVGHALKNHGTSVIFLSVRHKTSMDSICTSILKTLEPEFSTSDDVIFQTTIHLLSLEHPTVLVLDNTEDIQNSESL
jgi:KaiC/GvpD/RAD55 family RecA-like ATPase